MRSLFIVMLMAACSLPVSGQKIISSATIQLTFPQGEYKSTYPKTGIGARWNVMVRLADNSPLRIGGEIGYLSVSSSSRIFDIYYQGFYDRYRVSASSSILSLAFKARADLTQEQKLKLFVDGTVGTNLFFSSVDLTRETYYGGSQYTDGSSSKGYWSFIFGPGIGLEIPLGKSNDIALCIKGTYLFGSNTRYLTNPYIDDNGNVYYTQRESKTDMIVAEAGVRFSLSGRR